MSRIHANYSQLLDHEREFVDHVFNHREIYATANLYNVPLAGDDRIERAVDALARAVIESRRQSVLLDIAAGRDIAP